MQGRSHLILGIASGLMVAAATNAPHQTVLQLALAGAAGGLLPDIDCKRSMISGYFPGSNLVLGLTGVRHRTFTHSVIFLAVLYAVWYGASSALRLPYPYMLAIGAGVLSHIAADMMTPDGVPLLFPIPFYFRVLPRFILRWGGAFILESFANVAGVLAIIGAIYFIIN